MNTGHGMVQARLELDFESLRANCVNFLTLHQDEVQRMVNAQLDAMMSDGNLERLIAATIERELRSQLEQSIKDGIRHALWDKSAKNELAGMLLKGLNKFNKQLEDDYD